MRTRTKAAAVLLLLGVLPLGLFAATWHPPKQVELNLNQTDTPVPPSTNPLAQIGNLAAHPYLSVLAQLVPDGFAVYRADNTTYTLILGGGAAGSLSDQHTLFDLPVHSCAHFKLFMAGDYSAANISESLTNDTTLQGCLRG